MKITETESTKTFLIDFMKTMNTAEVYFFNKISEAGIKYEYGAALHEINSKYLTQKDRKLGKILKDTNGTPMALPGFPPEYDTNLENITAATINPKGDAIIETEKQDKFNQKLTTKFRYTIKKTTKGLAIDKKEKYSQFNEKWVIQHM